MTPLAPAMLAQQLQGAPLRPSTDAPTARGSLLLLLLLPCPIANAAKRELSEEAYQKLVEQEVANRAAEDAIEARSVTDALQSLGVGDEAGADKHPEK